MRPLVDKSATSAVRDFRQAPSDFRLKSLVCQQGVRAAPQTAFSPKNFLSESGETEAAVAL